MNLGRRFPLALAIGVSLAALPGQTFADPAGGVIYRKPGTQEPSGVLRDNAMGLVDRLVPPPSEGEITEAVKAALDEARRVGVTSMEDMDGSDATTRRTLFRLYQRLARAGARGGGAPRAAQHPLLQL